MDFARDRFETRAFELGRRAPSQRLSSRALGALLAAAGPMAPAAAWAEAPQPSTAPGRDLVAASEDERRRALLADALDDQPGRADLERYGPAVLGTLLLGAAVALPMADTEEVGQTSVWVLGGSAVALSAMSFSSYLVAEQYRAPMVSGALALTVFAGGLSFQLGERVQSTAARVTLGSFTVAGAVLAGMVAVDTALAPRVSALELERHLLRLEATGRRLSRADLAEIEADFSRTERPIPWYAFPLVSVGSGLVALSPILSKETSEDDDELAVTFGAVWLGIAMSSAIPAALLPRRGYAAYVDALAGAHLVPLGPGGSAGWSAAWTF